MEVKMNKEIRNYQESMFMGLNLRQCIFSLLAIAVAVGIYFGLGKYVGQEMTGWLCILGAAPFAACGFFQYHGMNAEQFAWAYIKSEFLYPKRLLFQSEDLYHACMEETLALLYREIFEKYYPGQAEMIAGFWMPNKEWEGCDVNDPSARVLSNYGESGK